MIRINPNPLPTGARFGFIRCGGPKGIRTLDLSDANRTLSQLMSYGPHVPFFRQHEYFSTSGAGCKGFFSLFPAGKRQTGRCAATSPGTAAPGRSAPGRRAPRPWPATRPPAPGSPPGLGTGVMRTPHMEARLMRNGPLESPAPRSAPEATMDAPNRGSAKATMRSTWLPRSMTSASWEKIIMSWGAKRNSTAPPKVHHAHTHPGDHPGEALGQVLPTRRRWPGPPGWCPPPPRRRPAGS